MTGRRAGAREAGNRGASMVVIIATYNRAALLAEALDALAAQQDPGVSVTIAVADNGSTDDTRAVFERARSRATKFEWLYVFEPRPGKSHAVNAALACAPGDWVAFTDDDVRPEPGWLAAIARAFSASNADFLVGRILPLWQQAPPRWLSPRLYGALGVPDNGPEPCAIGPNEHEEIMPIGTNMAVRRTALDLVGGLRTDLGKLRGTLRSGEDHELYLRLLHRGCRGIYAPGALVRHFVAAGRLRRGYFRQWFYQNGRNVATLEAGSPARTPMLLGLPRYLGRPAASDILQFARTAIARDAAERFRRETALLWFAGYLRQTWLRRPWRDGGQTMTNATSEVRA